MDSIKYNLYSAAVHSKVADMNKEKARNQFIAKGLKPVEADVIIEDFMDKFKDGNMTFADAGKHLNDMLGVINGSKNGEKSV